MRQRGFTILSLVIVIAILGIIAAGMVFNADHLFGPADNSTYNITIHPPEFFIVHGANQTTITAANKTTLNGGSYDWVTPQELLEKPIASLNLWELGVLVDYCTVRANTAPPISNPTKWAVMASVYQNQIIITLLQEAK